MKVPFELDVITTSLQTGLERDSLEVLISRLVELLGYDLARRATLEQFQKNILTKRLQ